MPSCEPNSLATSARCFAGIPPIQQDALIIALLCNWANGTSSTCAPSALAASAKCFLGFSPIQQKAIIIYLLCQIANSGSSPLTCANVSGSGSIADADFPAGSLFDYPDGFYNAGLNFYIYQSEGTDPTSVAFGIASGTWVIADNGTPFRNPLYTANDIFGPWTSLYGIPPAPTVTEC